MVIAHSAQFGDVPGGHFAQPLGQKIVIGGRQGGLVKSALSISPRTGVDNGIVRSQGGGGLMFDQSLGTSFPSRLPGASPNRTPASSRPLSRQPSGAIPLGFSLKAVEKESWPPGPPSRREPPKPRFALDPTSLLTSTPRASQAQPSPRKSQQGRKSFAEGAVHGLLTKKPEFDGTAPTQHKVSNEVQGKRNTTKVAEQFGSSRPNPHGPTQPAAGSSGERQIVGKSPSPEIDKNSGSVLPVSRVSSKRKMRQSQSKAEDDANSQALPQPADDPSQEIAESSAAPEENDDDDSPAKELPNYADLKGGGFGFKRNYSQMFQGAAKKVIQGRGLMQMFRKPKQSINTRIKKLQGLAKGRRVKSTVDEQEAKQKRFDALSQSELDALKQAFDHFDGDKSGALDAVELRNCLQELGLRGSEAPEKQEITRLCREITSDSTHIAHAAPVNPFTFGGGGGGWRAMVQQAKQQQSFGSTVNVEFFDFAADLVPKVRQRLHELRTEGMMRLFMRFDVDGTGSLSAEEVIEIGRSLTISPQVIQSIHQAVLAEEAEKKDEEQRGTERKTRFDAPESASEKKTTVIRRGSAAPMLRRKSLANAQEKLAATHGLPGELDFEQFLRLMLIAQEHAQRIKRAKERFIQYEHEIDAMTFKRFRADLVSLHESFKRFDVDASGELDHDEVLAVFTELGLMPKTGKERESVSTLIHESDKDGNSLVNFCEFLHLMHKIRNYLQDKQRADLLEQFQKYDRDKSHQLDVKEISNLMADLGLSPKTRAEQDEIKHILQDCDEDGSNEISFEEFQMLVQRVGEKLNAALYDLWVESAMELGFTEAQMRDFKWAFDRLDEDASNCLDMNEVRHALTMLRLNVVSEKFKAAFNQVDQDGNGNFDFFEFMAFMKVIRDSTHLLEDKPARPMKVQEFDARELRRILELCRLSKEYVKEMTKEEMVGMTCDFLGVKETDDLAETMNMESIEVLYEHAKNIGVERSKPSASRRLKG